MILVSTPGDWVRLKCGTGPGSMSFPCIVFIIITLLAHAPHCPGLYCLQVFVHFAKEQGDNREEEEEEEERDPDVGTGVLPDVVPHSNLVGPHITTSL